MLQGASLHISEEWDQEDRIHDQEGRIYHQDLAFLDVFLHQDTVLGFDLCGHTVHALHVWIAEHAVQNHSVHPR